ncbi:hypothetical protein NP493_494g00031 [Ridgeia piscesae]|uniref:Uncharacterized protein n=1 Tax=Ridgeia piscesae TaxID=27915 RepID=A0AAD9KXW9_RIDPI|nr:hypothetical protein NP493_494g00031 [Ridgeia piscesae]
MGMTLIDIAYTTSRYTSKCQAATFLPDWDPCHHGSFVYLWVASGVWTSVLVVTAGFFALFISRRRETDPRTLQFRKDVLAVACGLLATVFTPIALVLHSLEAYEGKDTFYYYVASDNGLHFNDAAKLFLPIAIALLSVVELCACAVTAFLCWRSRTVVMEDLLYSRRSSSRIADLYSRPYDGATTWPSYWRRYGDRRDVVTSYDQRKRSRLSRQRGYSVYSGYNGSLRPMTSSWYGGWGYDGRAKRKHPYGYVTAPGRYPMPYVYPMAYYMPHTYAATPSPMYY